MSDKKSGNFFVQHISVLTVSDTRDSKTNVSGKMLEQSIVKAGHNISESRIVKDSIYAIRSVVSSWIAHEKVNVIIATGGTGIFDSDVTPEALAVLFDKSISGFGELFRYMSYKEIGTSAMQSRVCAGIANNTIIFALPGSPNACATGWSIIEEQLDSRKKSCSFINVLRAAQSHSEAGSMNPAPGA